MVCTARGNLKMSKYCMCKYDGPVPVKDVLNPVCFKCKKPLSYARRWKLESLEDSIIRVGGMIQDHEKLRKKIALIIYKGFNNLKGCCRPCKDYICFYKNKIYNPCNRVLKAAEEIMKEVRKNKKGEEENVNKT